jgi:hypothetical protein
LISPVGGDPRFLFLSSAAHNGICSTVSGDVCRATANALPNLVQKSADDNDQFLEASALVSLPFHAENMAWSSGDDEQSEG